jgi:hypothetical protein
MAMHLQQQQQQQQQQQHRFSMALLNFAATQRCVQSGAWCAALL